MERVGIIVIAGISAIDISSMVAQVADKVEISLINELDMYINDINIIEYKELLTDYREPYAIDLRRPFISHQVIDRKPKHLIRKIIH